VTVTAPPRPPRPSDPVDREEVEALVEALIEEARQRARRRRRIYMAVAALVALVGVVIVKVFERTAQSQNASPALSARSSLPAGTTNSKIAFASLSHGGPGLRSTGLFVVNADGSGKQQLTKDAWLLTPAWSPDGRTIAFHGGPFDGRPEVYLMNADGSERRNLTREWGPREHPGLVARRAEDRLHKQPQRHTRGLRYERRWERAAEADAHLCARGLSCLSCLVTRRADDRVHTRSRQEGPTRLPHHRRRRLRHERRRERAAEPDAQLGA